MGYEIETTEHGKQCVIVGPLRIPLPPPGTSTEELNDIIANLLTDIKPLLPKGITEIGMPPLEPFFIDKLDLERKRGGGLVAVNAAATHLKFTGLSNLFNEQFIFHPEEMTMKFKLEIPNIRVDGRYNMGGTILFVPVKGKGDYTLHLGSVKVSGVCHLQVVNDVIQVSSMDVRMDILDIEIELKSLFKGNKLLNSLTNKLINEASQRLFHEIEPDLNLKVQQIVITITNAVLRALPFLTQFCP